MAIEIERKFLVASAAWQDEADDGLRIRQAYIASSDRVDVRVRIKGDDRAVLTLKSRGSGISRQEFEYDIPIDDAEALVEAGEGFLIEKVRHHVRHGGFLWEIDVFHGANAGLVVAEIELESEDQDFERPDWLGEDVTDDPRYLNVNLSRVPFSQWPSAGGNVAATARTGVVSS